MSTPSPSKFLTFYRRVTMHPALRRGALARAPRSLQPLASRPFSSSIVRMGTGKPSTDSSVKTDQYPDDRHTTNKKDTLDVQSENSAKGTEYVSFPSSRSTNLVASNLDQKSVGLTDAVNRAHSQGTGGTATSRSDARNSTQQAKKENPEAPDVVIGMQDERGGKGVTH